MKLPRELKVGAFALASIGLFLFGLGYLRGRSVLEAESLMQAYFEDVAGLEVGDRVVFKGHTVGRVRGIDYSAEKGNLRVSFDLSSQIKLPRDTKAMIAAGSLIGGMTLVLLPGKSTELATEGATLADSVQLGTLDKLSQRVDPVADKLEQVLTSLNTVLEALGPDTAGTNTRMGRILALVETTADNLAQGTGELKPLVANIRRVVQNIDHTLDSLKNSPELRAIAQNTRRVTDSLPNTLAQLNRSLEQARLTLAQLEGFSADLRAGKGSAGKLLTEDDLHTNLNESLNELELLLQDLRANPKRYVHFSLFGRRDKAK